MALSFRTHLLISHVLVAAVAVGAAAFALDRTLGDDLRHQAELRRQVERRLQRQALNTRTWVATNRHRQRLAHRLAQTMDARVSILAPDGAVLGDSTTPLADETPDLPEQNGQPEVAAARAGEVGTAVRTDERGVDMHFVAVDVGDGVILRVGVPQTDIPDAYADVRLRNRLLLITGLACLAAILVAVLAYHLATRPLRAMRSSAQRIAAGDYDIRVGTTAPDAFGELSRALADLGAQLRARIGELEAERDLLRRSERSRRDFLASASHEIRTPVTAISGYAETLQRGGVAEPTRAEFLDTIHRNAQRIGRLVDDLLRLAEAEAGLPERPRGPVPLAEAAGAAVQSVRGRVADAAVDIDVPADAVALGDRLGVEQILENLIDNALRHGGGRIAVSARRRDGRVDLVVEDDGPGIGAEHLPRLFERFYQVDPARSRERGGTGLGLAIVKELAESMGGAVRAESPAGGGTRITVELPAAG